MTGPLPYPDFFKTIMPGGTELLGYFHNPSKNMFLGYTKVPEHIYKKLLFLLAPTQKDKHHHCQWHGVGCATCFHFQRHVWKIYESILFSHHRRTTARVAPLLLVFFPGEMAPLNATAQVVFCH